MEGAILHTDSPKNLRLILELAKKLGVSTFKLSREEIEDYDLSIAKVEEKISEYANSKDFMPELDNENLFLEIYNALKIGSSSEEGQLWNRLFVQEQNELIETLEESNNPANLIPHGKMQKKHSKWL